jgi:hypothetical protein
MKRGTTVKKGVIKKAQKSGHGKVRTPMAIDAPIDYAGVVSFLVKEYQEVYDIVSKSRRPEDILVIRTRLEQLKQFTRNVGLPVLRLTWQFENLARDIYDRHASLAEISAALAADAEACSFKASTA